MMRYIVISDRKYKLVATSPLMVIVTLAGYRLDQNQPNLTVEKRPESS